jgi:hypothetical protein
MTASLAMCYKLGNSYVGHALPTLSTQGDFSMTGQFISGYLITQGGGPNNELPGIGRPVDPGYGVEQPVDPGYGFPLPPVIDNGLPPAPTHPIAPGGRPDQGPVRPTYPVDPGYGLPVAPGVWPDPPVTTWPPPQPVRPSHPIYPGGVGPEHPIVMPPGSVWPPLPPSITGKVLCFVWIVGVGYRWTVIDPGLKVDIGLPPTTPQPKR